MSELDLTTFVATDFEGRIRLANDAHGARLWSHQLASIWVAVLDELAGSERRSSRVKRRLLWELMALAPDSQAAESAYHIWIGDHDRSESSAKPPIVYLIVSCHKEPYKTKAIAHHRQLSAHLRPLFVVLGDANMPEAVFDGNFLAVPAPDNYEGLLWKVLEALVAVRRRFGRVGVLKIDDDTRFVAPPRHDEIADLVAATQYAGKVVGDSNFDRCWHIGKCERLGYAPYRRRFRGGWAAGPLYYLGPQAAEILIREYLFYPGEFDAEVFGLEDKAVGDTLGAHGVRPTERDLAPIFGIAGPFDGAFGDQPPALRPLGLGRREPCSERPSQRRPRGRIASMRKTILRLLGNL